MIIDHLNVLICSWIICINVGIQNGFDLKKIPVILFEG